MPNNRQIDMLCRIHVLLHWAFPSVPEEADLGGLRAPRSAVWYAEFLCWRTVGPRGGRPLTTAANTPKSFEGAARSQAEAQGVGRAVRPHERRGHLRERPSERSVAAISAKLGMLRSFTILSRAPETSQCPSGVNAMASIASG